MKLTYFGLLVALCFITFSCQQDEEVLVNQSSSEITAENWKIANPTKVFKSHTSGFKISKETLQKALSIEGASSVRFILETSNDNLQIRVVGVNNEGAKTKGSVVNQEPLLDALSCLVDAKNKLPNTAKLPNEVVPHVLQPIQAFNYVRRWEEFFQNSAFEEIISYNGVRIRHFSMPAAVIAQMINTGGVNLVWGINNDGKLSTVFLPMISENQVDSKEEGYIYDFSKPCPPNCEATKLYN